MKTYKVIDVVYPEDEGAAVFVGTAEECREWMRKQGFGYQLVPMTIEEIKFENSQS